MRFTSTLFFTLAISFLFGQDSGTLLLEQPDMNDTHIVFVHAADIWIVGVDGGNARRITSTAAVESDPHLSPDGRSIAFTSNRKGAPSVYVVDIDGGTPQRLTFHPSPAMVRGWSRNGTRILYASTREAAPVGFHRIWSVSRNGGPETMVSAQWATDISLSPDGASFAVDRVRRWDKEWRVYRGGQNTPLSILNLGDHSEVLLPNDQTTDIQPQWIGDAIYFLSDRDSTMNVWRYDVASQDVAQITRFRGSDIKHLTFNSTHLLYERDGAFHTLDLATSESTTLTIQVSGDFPWAEKTWEDVSKSVSSVSLSPTGKRAVMESRGEVFTVPVEHGNARNITRSSDAADRRPIWSPKGDRIAWFTDEGGEGYVLRIASQDGFSDARDYPIGPSKLGWEPAWSPDGDFIAFNDDDVRVQLLTLETGDIRTIDMGGVNLERGDMDLTWSPDSKWLAYSKTAANNFKRIHVWSMETGEVHTMTNPLAHCEHPAWDRDGRHLYFVSSTNLALGSGWANTSSMMADPEYSCFVINLRAEDASPFELRSDEEAAEEATSEEEEGGSKKKKDKGSDKKEDGDADENLVTIDFEGIEARTIAIPMKTARYSFLVAGPSGSFFVGERKPNGGGTAVHKFSLEKREASLFVENASRFSVSSDGKKAIARTGGSWKLFDTGGDKGKGESLNVNLRMDLDRFAE